MGERFEYLSFFFPQGGGTAECCKNNTRKLPYGFGRELQLGGRAYALHTESPGFEFLHI